MKKIKEKTLLIPLILLTLALLYTIYKNLFGTLVLEGITFNYEFNLKQWLAIIFTIFTIVSYFISKKLYNYSLNILIIAALFNLVHFFPVSKTWGLSMEVKGFEAGFNIELKMLIVVFVNIIVYYIVIDDQEKKAKKIINGNNKN